MAAPAGIALAVVGVWIIAQTTAGHAIDRLGLIPSILNTPKTTPGNIAPGGTLTIPPGMRNPGASYGPAYTSAASGALDTNPWPAVPAASNYPGTLDQWVSQAVTILNATGTPANPDDINTIIKYESGGNPVALNNYDVNAVNGHPSIGLMQTIRSTFNAHALPGHYDIFNPVDNIIAAVRYAQAVYGGLSQVPGIVSVHNGGPYVPY
jgi:soluble lytic murein transglycosylase-like protein